MTVIDESIAELALDMASPMIDGLIEFEVISRGELCVIVALGDGNGLFDVLRTKRVGVPEEWEEDYEAIATGKIKMMAETGLNSRVAVLLHLLAPNNRPQQVTDDLASFWRTTYHQVRKDLRRRYPKHAWPEDPFQATAQRRPK